MSQENHLSEHVSFIDHSWDAPVAAADDAWTKSLGESTMASGERRGSTGTFRPTNHADLRDVVTIQSETHGQNQGPSLRDQLVFDLDQAWQRSLMHHLDDLEDVMEDDHPRPRADRILLGHAESGDFALECEDDLTIVTETSLTVPTRMQMIHRTMRQIALFQDDEDDGDQTTDSSIHRSSKIAEPREGINSSPRGVFEGPYGQNHVSDAAASSAKPIPLINLSEDEDGGIITTTTFTTMDDHRDENLIDRRAIFLEGSKDLRPIPHQLPKNRNQDLMNHPSPPPPPPPARKVTLGSEAGDHDAVPVGIYRSPAFSEDLPLYYPSRKSTSMDDTDYINEQGQAGCMCLGYNLLDFLLPESSPQVKYRHKKRRMSAAPVSQSISNLRSSLGRVDEVLDESMMNADGEILMQDTQVLEHSASIHQHHSTDQQYIQYDQTRTSQQVFISNNGNDVYVHRT